MIMVKQLPCLQMTNVSLYRPSSSGQVKLWPAYSNLTELEFSSMAKRNWILWVSRAGAAQWFRTVWVPCSTVSTLVWGHELHYWVMPEMVCSGVILQVLAFNLLIVLLLANLLVNFFPAHLQLYIEFPTSKLWSCLFCSTKNNLIRTFVKIMLVIPREREKKVIQLVK